MLTDIEIYEGDAHEALDVYRQIPELSENLNALEFRRRIEKTGATILIASAKSKSIGFKVGYAEEANFYNWIGGVVPSFRNLGVAGFLAEVMELKAQKYGFDKIRFKTLNKFKPMLIFALKSGYEIIGTTFNEKYNDTMIILEKQLEL